MFTSLGKILLISNDLQACKLLNQQSLPLQSSLKFALFLCQIFRQASPKPSNDLQRCTHIVQCFVEKRGDGELVWSLDFIPCALLSTAFREGKNKSTSFPAKSAPAVNSKAWEPASAHILLIFSTPCYVCFCK